MKERNKLMLIAFCFLLLGIAIGYGMGVQAGITWSVKFASHFMTIEFDENLIAEGIFKYKNQIGGCFQNAPILNDTWD